MNDADFLRAILEKHPGQWVRHIDILNESFRERGCGLTVHSRAATLRERGLIVECRTEKNEVGRLQSFYRLGGLTEGGNGAPTSSPSPPSLSPPGSPSGGADAGLAAALTARTVGPSAPPEDAAAGSPNPTSPAAATLFDLPAEPAWA